MSNELARLFNEFDRGNLTRRQLLQVLGIAAVARPVSAFAFGQGGCGGARASLPECDPTPAKLPFEPTGWTTVLLDHFSLQVADYEKEAAYYAALMNWKVRSDDGKKAVLDIGDWGGIVIRGGYEAPPPPPPPPAAAVTGGGAAGGGGTAGGRRGGGPPTPRLAVFDSFCWGVAPWDAKKVEAELRKRGLNPVADNDGKDFQSFHVKDPGGFDLQISNGSRNNRRQGLATGKLAVAAPFEPTAWKTVWLDHISFQASDYKASVAFYAALLGWRPGKDEGSQNQCQIGEVGDIIIRRGGGGRRGGAAAGAAGADPAGAPGVQATPPPRPSSIDHISFGISPWEPDAVKAELDKRGLTGSADTGGRGDIHTASYQSYHTATPNGFNLQISNSSHANRSSSVG